MTTGPLFSINQANSPLLNEKSLFFNESYKYKIKISFNWLGRKIYEIKDCIVEKIKKITSIIYNFITNSELMNKKFCFKKTSFFTHNPNKSKSETTLKNDSNKSSVSVTTETIFNEDNGNNFHGYLSPKHHNDESQLRHNFVSDDISDDIHEAKITFNPSYGCEVLDEVNDQNIVTKESSLGIFVRGEPVGFIVEQLREGFPVAEDKTLKIGDIIIEVEDKNVKGIFITQLAEMLKGPAGSLVKLKVLRQPDHPSIGFYRPVVLILKRGFE
jgi:hypothetical protein